MEHSIQDGIEAGLRPHSTQPVKEIVRAHAVASVIVDQLKGVLLVQHLQVAMEVGDVFSSPPRCRCALDVDLVPSICVPISTHLEVHRSLQRRHPIWSPTAAILLGQWPLFLHGAPDRAIQGEDMTFNGSLPEDSWRSGHCADAQRGTVSASGCRRRSQRREQQRSSPRCWTRPSFRQVCVDGPSRRFLRILGAALEACRSTRRPHSTHWRVEERRHPQFVDSKLLTWTLSSTAESWRAGAGSCA